MARTRQLSAGHRNAVLLEMSPLPSNIRLARLVASGLGSELGLTAEEIDDLRIAVDEACYWLVAYDVVDLLQVRFTESADELSICVSADLRREPSPMPAAAHQVLDAVTAEWSLRQEGVAFELQISPRRDGSEPR